MHQVDHAIGAFRRCLNAHYWLPDTRRRTTAALELIDASLIPHHYMWRAFILLLFSMVAGCVTSQSRAARLAPPAEELAGELRQAIWYDLQSNALIGNGNELAARWANANSDRDPAPKLHIQDLVCDSKAKRLACEFRLLRDGGVGTYLGETAPDRLACNARFRRADGGGGWSIPRLPPGPNGGHSRITIKCEPVSWPPQ